MAQNSIIRWATLNEAINTIALKQVLLSEIRKGNLEEVYEYLWWYTPSDAMLSHRSRHVNAQSIRAHVWRLFCVLAGYDVNMAMELYERYKDLIVGGATSSRIILNLSAEWPKEVLASHEFVRVVVDIIECGHYLSHEYPMK